MNAGFHGARSVAEAARRLGRRQLVAQAQEKTPEKQKFLNSNSSSLTLSDGRE
jgi:hypothetical protein